MQHKLPYILLAFFYGVAFWAIAQNEAFYGGSDSVEHFLFAEFAFEYPQHFLNHWAKPLYVAIYAPFAQFGFISAKLLSLHLLVFSAIFLLKRLHKQPNAQLIFTLLFTTSSGIWLASNSALTEPLFAFITCCSYYFYSRNKLIVSLLVLSFLPFVRSEGLLFLGLAGGLLVLNKSLKYLPLLAIGTLAYGLIGWFSGKSLLWMFTEIPYSAQSSVYGSGSLFRFVEGIYYLVGPLNSFIISIGLICTGIAAVKTQTLKSKPIIALLFFLLYLAFHSVAWYWGRFNSMGLLRVLVGVLPLLFFVAAVGADGILSTQPKRYVNLSLALILVVNIVLLFSSNPASVKWNSCFEETEQQQLAQQLIGSTQKKGIHQYYFNAPLFGLYTKQFDASTASLHGFHKHQIEQESTKNQCFIWDTGHQEFDYQLTQDEFIQFFADSNLYFSYTSAGELLYIAGIKPSSSPK